MVGGGSLLATTAGAAGIGALLATATPAGATTYTVVNLLDSGPGSLRTAVDDANGNPGADVIDFAPGLSGTITLTSKLTVTDHLTVTGPGSEALTVSGNQTNQIFYIYNGSQVGALVATISGLTLTDGYDAGWGGGAIASWSADLTLRDVVITNSTTVGGQGGAILQSYSANYENRNSHLTMVDCVVSGNSAVSSVNSWIQWPGAGGGLALYRAGSADISDTIFENNTSDAASDGGGIFADSLTGQLNVSRTRISGNTAGDGAGVRVQRQYATGSIDFDAVSIVDNTSSDPNSAAVSFDHTDGTTDITSSTIADNTGGGIRGMDATSLHLRHSTIAGNTGVGLISLNRGVNVDSSLLADNIGGDLGSDADVNWSLVETSGAHIVAGGDNVTGVDPGLLALATPSSTTWIRPFANTSAAFNAGDPTFSPPPATDQMGNPRVAFGRIDMGAFELQPVPDPTSSTTVVAPSDEQIAPAFTG